MAMLPFIGYHVGDYLQHWLKLGQEHDQSKLPRIFYVNWFRRGADGKFLWPGYGENSRVIKWAIEQIEGADGSVETPIGLAPKPGSLDVDGLDVSAEDIQTALHVDSEEWKQEIPLIEEWFAKIGDKLPSQLVSQLEKLKARL
jgi:phosphoenolpyruvate carboxykinase (GTP)